MKKIIFLSFALILIEIFQSNQASACSCLPISTAEAYIQGVNVFIGRVSHVNALPQNDPDLLPDQETVLEVTKLYKGPSQLPAPKKISLLQRNLSTSCGYPLEAGKSYLIFTREHRSKKELNTHYCYGTKLLKDASSDIAWLEEHRS